MKKQQNKSNRKEKKRNEKTISKNNAEPTKITTRTPLAKQKLTRWPSSRNLEKQKRKAVSILYPHRKSWRSSHGKNFPRNFKRPKNGEDGSNFDDFWTKRIAALSAKFCKIFALSKKFSRGRKLQKTLLKSSKKLVPRAISGEKQNRNGHLSDHL